MDKADTSISMAVIPGLAAGIVFVVLFSVLQAPESMLSDDELISKHSKIPEVKYFLDKYPDAIAEVDRNPNEEYLTITFSVERQVEPPSDLYTGINSLGVSVYTKPNHLSLAIFCGVSQGVSAEWGLDGIDKVDAIEGDCFPEPVMEGPSPEEMPFFEDDWSDDKEYWFPKNVPSTGSPHILTQKLEGKPESFYQVMLSEVPWIQDGINNDRELVKMDDNSVAEFFAFYEKQDTFSPYFEVTFPDGSVEYYEVTFTEVP